MMPSQYCGTPEASRISTASSRIQTTAPLRRRRWIAQLEGARRIDKDLGNDQPGIKLVICVFGPQTAVIVVLLVRAAMRRARARIPNHDLCATCGYDLRATPDRCPECGREAVSR